MVFALVLKQYREKPQNCLSLYKANKFPPDTVSPEGSIPVDPQNVSDL